MRTLPPEPNAGERISATLVREIIRAIRERTVIAGTGVKASFGPNGTVVSAAPSSAAASHEDKGCFKIVNIERASDDGSDGESSDGGDGEEESCTITVTFGNAYYMIGGKIYDLTPAASDDGEEEAEGLSVEAEAPCIVYLSIPATDGAEETCELATCETLAALATAQQDPDSYLIPLYKFDDTGSVECDFRNCPTAFMGEF